MTYTVIVNQPGYLPEHPADVSEWESVPGAREGLVIELRTTAESQGDYDREALDNAIVAARMAMVEQSVMLGGWAHTIVEVRP